MSASGNEPGFDTLTGPPQTPDDTGASSQPKRGKRPHTRRTNTKAVEKEYQKKRRLKKLAVRLRNAKKTDGSVAEEEEEEGEEAEAGKFSDSDYQHDIPASEVKLVEEKYPLDSTFSKTSTWLAMEDHPFSNLLTQVKRDALKRRPRNDNPLEERDGADPFKLDLSRHVLCGLLQVVGDLAPSPCKRCEKGFGRWKECVVSHNHSSADLGRGACANSMYTSNGVGFSLKVSAPQATPASETNPELEALEGKGFPSHTAAREAIKDAQQHNGHQITYMSGNLNSGKPIYKKYRCFRYDDLTSGGVKIDDPCFWSIRVDRVEDSWVVRRPEGTHSHEAVDFSMPKRRWRCDVCEQYFFWSEKDSHICPGAYGECYKCINRFPKSELPAHRLTCLLHACGDCQMRRIEDMDKHREQCPGRPKIQCWKCRRYHDKDEFEEHFEVCDRWYCRHCLTVIPASERDKHRKTCEE
ncbi:hypothetical protein LX36DRAFT_728993 [Colletotrichum falcatum]|nr:hypothetical protein LX36DRAFT_728993 [Colletotrichum falcatum]